MVKIHSPINQAMQSQLAVMEHFLHNMLDNVTEAQTYLDDGKRDAAIGTLLCSRECFESIGSLYETLLMMHRNAALVERDDNQ